MFFPYDFVWRDGQSVLLTQNCIRGGGFAENRAGSDASPAVTINADGVGTKLDDLGKVIAAERDAAGPYKFKRCVLGGREQHSQFAPRPGPV